jgi:general secretion pathway protein N
MVRTALYAGGRPALANARPPWAWAGVGALAGLLLATLLFAPARWLAAALSQLSAEQLQLQQAQGTVWDGSARLVLSAGSGASDAATLPGPLQWRIRPRWDGLQLTLAAPCCLDTPWHWRLRVDGQGLQLQADDLGATASHWPAALLSGLGTPWNTVQLQGTLAVYTQGLEITVQRDRWALQGAVAVDGLGLSTALSTLQPLGSYRLALQGGTSPQITLSTLNGKLLLSGQGQLLQGRWRFVGEARSDEAAQGALGNLLNIIGRREGARSIITLG